MRHFHENEIFKIAASRLKKDGWHIISEIFVKGRNIDGAAIKNGVLIVIEAKTKFSKKLIYQLSQVRSSANHVLAVIGTGPPKHLWQKYLWEKKYLNWCRNENIGVWLIENGEIKVLNNWGLNKYIKEFDCEELKKIVLTKNEDLNGGGLPGLKGTGPAQELRKSLIRITENYVNEHPQTTWKEIIKNVPFLDEWREVNENAPLGIDRYFYGDRLKNLLRKGAGYIKINGRWGKPKRLRKSE